MCLRVERVVGERKDTSASSSSSFDSDSYASLSPSSSSSSSSSCPSSPSLSQSRASKPSSISSMNRGFSKVTDSLRRAGRWLSDSSLPRPSAISFNKHVAADTVTRIDTFPKKARIIRTIDFKSAERSQRLSLWDLVILSYVIHQDSTTYDLFGRQCFWFADTISAILEKWSEICNGVSVKNMARTRIFKHSHTPCGRVKGFSFHQRKPEDVDKIWALFFKKRQEMNMERQSYEDTKAEEARKTEKLAGQVEELRLQQAQERQKWEWERKAWQEKERWLMKEQEERERQLKQQIAEQECAQQRLQEQLRKNDRRFPQVA